MALVWHVGIIANVLVSANRYCWYVQR